GDAEAIDPTLPTSRGGPGRRPTRSASLPAGVPTDSVAAAAAAAEVVLVDLGSGGADRIPAGDAHALHVAGGGVAAVGVEKMAAVGHLLGHLAVGGGELGGLDPRSGGGRGPGGEGRPHLGAGARAGARRAVVLLEQVGRA